MGYYLRFSDGSGSASANNQVFQISGVSGVLTNLSYTVMETLNAFTGVARYIMDGRRKLDDDVGTSGDRIYTFQTNSGSVGDRKAGPYTINGVSAAKEALFTLSAGDVVNVEINGNPAGVISFGSRYNATEHFYGLAVSTITLTDAAGDHTFDMSDSGGTATTFTSTDGLLTAKLFNFPVDNSHWVSYSTGPETPINPSITSLLATSARLNWEQG